MNLEAKLFPRAIFILLAPQSIISITISSRSAGVIANYDAKINGNVAEYRTINHGKLSSLTIFFDTLTFMNNSK